MDPTELPPEPPAPKPEARRWGCWKWGLLIAAVLLLLCGLCTVVVLTNLDFR